MIRIAICDDDSGVIETFESYLDKLKDFSFEYDVFFDGYELEQYLLRSGQEYDLYLLDIEMKTMDGLTFARHLRNSDSHALIVFITGYSKYVYDVFEVFTFDFILKPIQFERMKKVLTKAFLYLKDAQNVFTFSYRKNSFSLSCDKIFYIDKIGRKAYIHTAEKTYQCNMTIDEIWQQLNQQFFVSTRASCIVNLAYITQIIKDEVILRNGTKLFAGREYKQNLKLKHLNFIRSQL